LYARTNSSTASGGIGYWMDLTGGEMSIEVFEPKSFAACDELFE
jgi:hypothetical protein